MPRQADPGIADTGAGQRPGSHNDRRRAISRTVELPLAQHILQPGLAATVYERHNRLRKSLATAFYLHVSHHGLLNAEDISSLTQHQMATAARSAGVAVPNSDETRELIRNLLRVFNRIDAPASTPAPTRHSQITEGELATALDHLGIIVKAATLNVSR